ncbi:MAG: hypothetical protein WA361_00420, partial [Candidatus Acidiferrales bacterium]
IAENFQFSHRVYLLLVSWRSKKMYTLLFCFQAKSTHKNLRYQEWERLERPGKLETVSSAPTQKMVQRTSDQSAT